MKNIHVFPTPKPSKLYKEDSVYKLDNLVYGTGNQNIYITNDEDIKDGDYGIYLFDNTINKIQIGVNYSNPKAHKKIILTTDQDLIKDGVQAIDDEFLEWFVKNPSCEFVEINTLVHKHHFGFDKHKNTYKIIIPKEEPKERLRKKLGVKHPKQETLEEAAENFSKNHSIYDSAKDDTEYGFINGAKWQQQQDKNKYSDEEMIELIQLLSMNEEFNGYGSVSKETAKYFLEQFKKK